MAHRRAHNARPGRASDGGASKIGAAVTWVATNFIGKPLRDLYDRRREIARRFIVFGNVRAVQKRRRHAD
jgi:hypothetical protein